MTFTTGQQIECKNKSLSTKNIIMEKVTTQTIGDLTFLFGDLVQFARHVVDEGVTDRFSITTEFVVDYLNNQGTVKVSNEPVRKFSDVQELMDDNRKWANETFPKATLISCLKHLQKEVKETIEAVAFADMVDGESLALTELADMYLLLLQAASRKGFSFEEVYRTSVNKMKTNKKRDWKETDIEGVYEHTSDTNDGFVIREIDTKKWYWCKCQNCGWEDSSEYAEGGHPIADTGDHTDPLCPICFSREIDGTPTIQVSEEGSVVKVKIPFDTVLSPYKKTIEALNHVIDNYRWPSVGVPVELGHSFNWAGASNEFKELMQKIHAIHRKYSAEDVSGSWSRNAVANILKENFEKIRSIYLAVYTDGKYALGNGVSISEIQKHPNYLTVINFSEILNP